MNKFLNPLIAAGCMVFAVNTFAANRPTITLFPQSLKMELKEAHASSEALRVNVDEAGKRMGSLTRKYNAGNCKGHVPIVDCSAIKQQMWEARDQMIETVKERLPEFQRQVKKVFNSLNDNLQRASRSMSPEDYQKALLTVGKKKLSRFKGRTAIGNSVSFFRDMNRMLANGNVNPILLAAQARSDLKELKGALVETQQLVSNHGVTQLFRDAWGSLDESMVSDVESANIILFGETVAGPSGVMDEIGEQDDYSQIMNQYSTLQFN
jgi:hypothetical protein